MKFGSTSLFAVLMVCAACSSSQSPCVSGDLACIERREQEKLERKPTCLRCLHDKGWATLSQARGDCVSPPQAIETDLKEALRELRQASVMDPSNKGYQNHYRAAVEIIRDLENDQLPSLWQDRVEPIRSPDERMDAVLQHEEFRAGRTCRHKVAQERALYLAYVYALPHQKQLSALTRFENTALHDALLQTVIESRLRDARGHELDRLQSLREDLDRTVYVALLDQLIKEKFRFEVDVENDPTKLEELSQLSPDDESRRMCLNEARKRWCERAAAETDPARRQALCHAHLDVDPPYDCREGLGKLVVSVYRSSPARYEEVARQVCGPPASPCARPFKREVFAQLAEKTFGEIKGRSLLGAPKESVDLWNDYANQFKAIARQTFGDTDGARIVQPWLDRAASRANEIRHTVDVDFQGVRAGCEEPPGSVDQADRCIMDLESLLAQDQNNDEIRLLTNRLYEDRGRMGKPGTLNLPKILIPVAIAELVRLVLPIQELQLSARTLATQVYVQHSH